MNTDYKPKIMTNTDNRRSYFDWGSNMQVIRKGKGEIAMTEGELVRFFGVTWRKLNYRLQTIMKTSTCIPMKGVQVRRKSLSTDNAKVIHRSIRFLSSSPCPFSWTARKRICSESTSVEDCRQRLPL